MAFTLCTAPYILMLEEDWVFRKTDIPILGNLVDILTELDKTAHNVYSMCIKILYVAGPIKRYDVYTHNLKPARVWVWTNRRNRFYNGGCMYRMSNINEMRKREDFSSEKHWMGLARRMGYDYGVWDTEGRTRISSKTMPDFPIFVDHMGIGDSAAAGTGKCFGEVFED
jgi:hypothetical protein